MTQNCIYRKPSIYIYILSFQAALLLIVAQSVRILIFLYNKKTTIKKVLGLNNIFCAFLAILSIQKAFPGLVLGIRKHNQHYIKKYSREKTKLKNAKNLTKTSKLIQIESQFYRTIVKLKLSWINIEIYVHIRILGFRVGVIFSWWSQIKLKWNQICSMFRKHMWSQKMFKNEIP